MGYDCPAENAQPDFLNLGFSPSKELNCFCSSLIICIHVQNAVSQFTGTDFVNTETDLICHQYSLVCTTEQTGTDFVNTEMDLTYHQFASLHDRNGPEWTKADFYFEH